MQDYLSNAIPENETRFQKGECNYGFFFLENDVTLLKMSNLHNLKTAVMKCF